MSCWRSPGELKKLLERIAEEAKVTPCIFLDHPITRERIKQLGYDGILDIPGITRLPEAQLLPVHLPCRQGIVPGD